MSFVNQLYKGIIVFADLGGKYSLLSKGFTGERCSLQLVSETRPHWPFLWRKDMRESSLPAPCKGLALEKNNQMFAVLYSMVADFW